ncbi:MAG: glycoside hydrolase family 1 protein [Candidatus Binatia bacterium]
MKRLEFPKGFLWGSATAAHQVEGNCDRNHWWAWEQEGLERAAPRGYIRDGSTSGIACDYYHRYDDDHRLAAELGHQALRISIEWSRVEPERGRFDQDAIDHYKRVCDSMLDHGLQPTLTLHHFTNPTWAQREGGWENPDMPAWLARFAAYAAREIGDRVKVWWTINEPMIAPTLGYLLGIHPPCVRDFARALVVSRHVLLAHGLAYAAIHEAVRHAVEAGPVMAMPYFEPFDPGSESDRAVTEASDEFMNEYFLRGVREGIIAPPVGGGEKVAGLEGSFDLIGVNYYMRVLGQGGDAGIDLVGKRRPSEPDRLIDEMGWEIFPDGLYRHLVRVAKLGKPVYVTENGMATLDDSARTEHLREHLERVWRAIRDGADVRGYFYWSLMDNFEWAEGYGRRFGLVAVDRQTLERRPRPAAYVYRDVIAGKALEID